MCPCCGRPSRSSWARASRPAQAWASSTWFTRTSSSAECPAPTRRPDISRVPPREPAATDADPSGRRQQSGLGREVRTMVSKLLLLVLLLNFPREQEERSCNCGNDPDCEWCGGSGTYVGER